MSNKIHTFKQTCRTRPNKNSRWDAKERFSMVHDKHSRSLISDVFGSRINEKPRRRGRQGTIEVYRSKTFGMTVEERTLEDARYFLYTGKAASIEEAVSMAIANR
jgi:hypothetical protein